VTAGAATAPVLRGPGATPWRPGANAASAAALGAIVVWLGPPGSDLAAHVFQRNLFLTDGFLFWTNYWYAGRYSFVGYSLIYYPLAAFFGIKLLAVLSVAGATAAFTIVAERTWGSAAIWAARCFAAAAAASALTAAFPYGLGLAFALTALVALSYGRTWIFAALVALTFAASPLAFVLLLVILVGVAASRSRREIARPALGIAGVGAVAVLLWRLFPDGGRFPFSTVELLAALAFCGLGLALTWRVERARILRSIFAVYGLACLAAYAIPSALGENVARFRYAAVPLAVLTLSLRRWRPLPYAIVAFVLALSWNATPLAYSFFRTSSDPSAAAGYWQPVIGFLHRNLSPAYRVEAVDTTGHWEAVYLTQARIPIVRGWFRQADFPQNELLYGSLSQRAYLAWLHRMGVRYVVLTNGPLDYSARTEATLLRGGHSGLRPVFRGSNATVFAVPSPVPIVTGPAHPRVLSLGDSSIVLSLARPGTYRVALHYSPYMAAPNACIRESSDGMIDLQAQRAGVLTLAFTVTASHALAAIAGSRSSCPGG
jgi:hypothetical protein